MQREAALPGSFDAGRPQSAGGHRQARPPGRPRHERGDRGPQELRLRRQPHGRQEQQRQPRRASWSSTSNPANPTVAERSCTPFEGIAQRVLARAARLALAGHPDRPAHQLRRQRRAPVRAATNTQRSASTTSRARTPRNPQLLYQNTRDTHEFFIWEDPKNPKRALLFASSAGSNFQIYDISPMLKARDPATPAPVRSRDDPARASASRRGFNGATASATPAARASTPSRSPTTASGSTSRCSRAASASATCRTSPTTTRPRTPTGSSRRTANRVQWPGPGAHSAVKLWNKDWVYVSDEVYGTITAAGHGCPWGWARFVDIADPTRPVVRERVPAAGERAAVLHRLQPAAHVVLGAQPDADAEHRVQHLALGRLPGDGHHQPGDADAARRVQARTPLAMVRQPRTRACRRRPGSPRAAPTRRS